VLSQGNIYGTIKKGTISAGGMAQAVRASAPQEALSSKPSSAKKKKPITLLCLK
jgi:hypothetical protein